jgi:hypothetical protein
MAWKVEYGRPSAEPVPRIQTDAVAAVCSAAFGSDVDVNMQIENFLFIFPVEGRQTGNNKDKERGQNNKNKSILPSKLLPCSFSFLLYSSVLFGYFLFLYSFPTSRTNPVDKLRVSVHTHLHPTTNITTEGIRLPVLIKLNVNIISPVFVGPVYDV